MLSDDTLVQAQPCCLMMVFFRHSQMTPRLMNVCQKDQDPEAERGPFKHAFWPGGRCRVAAQGALVTSPAGLLVLPRHQSCCAQQDQQPQHEQLQQMLPLFEPWNACSHATTAARNADGLWRLPGTRHPKAVCGSTTASWQLQVRNLPGQTIEASRKQPSPALYCTIRVGTCSVTC